MLSSNPNEASLTDDGVGAGPVVCSLDVPAGVGVDVLDDSVVLTDDEVGGGA